MSCRTNFEPPSPSFHTTTTTSLDTIAVSTTLKEKDTSIINSSVAEPSVILDPGIILPPCQPFTKDLFEKGDPSVKAARKEYLKSYLTGLLMVILTIFSVFAIYWGSLWKVPAHSLRGWIVDFDGGRVGQGVTQTFLDINRSNHVIKWKVIPPSKFHKGVTDVAHALKDEQTWAAIVINAGASDALQATTDSPDPTYNGSQAITVYVSEARNENAYRAFIRPVVQMTLETFKLEFAIQFASEISTLPNIVDILSVSPQTLANPVSYTLVNLIPFNQAVASAVVFVGLIYLLILSFFIVNIAFHARHVSGLETMLNFSLAFKLDLTRNYGQAGFLVFWMCNWFGMLSVGLALESLITLLTPRYIPFFMILWIIVDVSVCVFPIDVLPTIFHYGYAAPFYNVSKSIRSLAFGTKDTLGFNFAILVIWIIISCLSLPTIQWFIRRKQIREREAATSHLTPEINLPGDV
ncbi:putative endoplasmic reticulum membrane protein [Psilocybe cubensis]|uniref:DUF3533 domain-containing protein n=2 Tax=Psilocybe cubensis TaxID=181762 RepID=A0A8H7XMW3_PSICU|nr:putative endoplasmic reticulum membrane protein [Psilocybe cubensis]KAH9483287.1 putative endoplasmic reticulum membrane protein [Psilocybe cubensis]